MKEAAIENTRTLVRGEAHVERAEPHIELLGGAQQQKSSLPLQISEPDFLVSQDGMTGAAVAMAAVADAMSMRAAIVFVKAAAVGQWVCRCGCRTRSVGMEQTPWRVPVRSAYVRPRG